MFKSFIRYCGWFFFSFVFFSVFALGNTFAQTYYVRPDGGTALQCDGTVNAPYSENADKKCAWSHPFWALDSNGKWKIKGGDTLIIYSGSYKIGYGAPNTGWCDSHWPWSCTLPPIPSGPDKDHPTKILGMDNTGKCSNPPELWGTERVNSILNLANAQNVVVSCLEITDHEDCTELHELSEAACKRDTYPFGEWAKYGLIGYDSHDIILKDLNIHGLANRGVVAYRIKDWQLINVRIAANGWSGWEGDAGPGNVSSNSGTIYFKNVTIEWNGCVEDYPNKGHYKWCWSGYGDGLGTGATAGEWIIEDSVVRYNTSDGLDLLYLKEEGAGPVIIKRSQFYGNAGNQIKVRSRLHLENSVLVSSCSFFEGKDFTYKVTTCRAGGATIALSPTVSGENVIVNNTVLGQGDVLLLLINQSAPPDAKLKVYNNIFYGNDNVFNGYKTGLYWADVEEKLPVIWSHNVIYNVKSVQLDASNLFVDPKLKKPTLFDFDLTLLSTSPAIDFGLPIGYEGIVPAVDIAGNSRKVGKSVDCGAYEFSSTSVLKGSSFASGDYDFSSTVEYAVLPETNTYDEASNDSVDSASNDVADSSSLEDYNRGFSDGVNFCKMNPEKCGIQVNTSSNCAYVDDDFISIPCVQTKDGTYSAYLKRVLDSPVELYVLESVY